MFDGIVCLENDARSMIDEVEVIQRHGIDHKICARPRTFGGFLQEGNGPRVKGFVLDMHIPGIRTLAEINMPTVETSDGEAVGLAVAEKYLWRSSSRYRDVPVVLLTGYDMQARIRARINKLRSNGKDVVALRKGSDLSLFEKFVARLKNKGVPEYLRDRGRQSPRRLDHYNEGITLAMEVLREFRMTSKEIAALFGYATVGDAEWRKIENRLRERPNMDVSDRVDFIIEIKSRLVSIFGEDVNLQKKWLQTAQDALEGRSPLKLLKSTHQHEIAHVLGLLRKITG